MRLVPFKRAAGEIDQHVGSERNQLGDWIGLLQWPLVIKRVRLAEPSVLADVDAELDPAQFHRPDTLGRPEVTLLIEHVVIWQQRLVNRVEHLAIEQQAGRVGDAPFGHAPLCRMPNQHRQSARQLFRQGTHCSVTRMSEPFPQQQILWRISADKQLGRDQQFGTGHHRLLGG